MSSDSASDARDRFARDVRRIREHRDVSIDAIHESTRIARNLIEAFERGELYDHPAFNRVYLRSFVRAYADTVEIDPDVALDALDRALDGAYTNGLVVRYLNQEPLSESAQEFARDAASNEASSQQSSDESSREDAPGEDASPETESSETESSSQRSPDPVGSDRFEARPLHDDASEASEEDAEESDPQRTAPGADIPRYKETEDVASEDAGEQDNAEEHDNAGEQDDTGVQDDEEGGEVHPAKQEVEDDAPRSPSKSPTSSPSDVPTPSPGDPSFDVDAPSENVDASAGDDASSSSAPGDSSAQPVNIGTVGEGMDFDRAPQGADRPARSSNRPSLAVIGGGVATLVVFVALAFFLLSGGDEREESTPPATPAADTSAAPAEPDTAASEPERPPLANLTLGSELTLTVVPSEDVQGLRIQRDDDLRRPYWLEADQAYAFPFEDRVLISDPPETARILVEGYEYPIRNLDDQDRLVVTRDSVEAFADTLRGDPVSLASEPVVNEIPPDTSAAE